MRTLRSRIPKEYFYFPIFRPVGNILLFGTIGNILRHFLVVVENYS